MDENDKVFFSRRPLPFPMLKRIGGRTYNSATALFIQHFWRGDGSNFEDFKADLFVRSRSNEYFIAGLGEGSSPFGRYNRRGEPIPGAKIILVPEECGDRWLDPECFVEEFEEWFRNQPSDAVVFGEI